MTAFLVQIPIVNSRTDVAPDAESVVSFFNKTCAVGTSGDGPAQGGEPWDQLCSACGVGYDCVNPVCRPLEVALETSCVDYTTAPDVSRDTINPTSTIIITSSSSSSRALCLLLHSACVQQNLERQNCLQQSHC